jgi:thiopeptide-type bacteriocin biosynthesis protein
MNDSNDTWLAGHLYYSGHWESFLRQAVSPFIDRIMSQGLATQFFFIRYWERGPHIRLRLKGETDLLEVVVKPQCKQFFLYYYERYPSQREDPTWIQDAAAEQRWFPNNSVQFIAYEAEVERYGGPEGMLLSEQQFQASSRAVLALLQDSETWSYERALGAAIQLHLIFAAALGMDAYAAAQFYTQVSRHWLNRVYPAEPHLPDRERTRRQQATLTAYAHTFAHQRRTLVPYHEVLWNALATGVAFDHPWLNQWQNDMEQLAAALSVAQHRQRLITPWWFQYDQTINITEEKQQLWPIFESYVHMTNNRLGILNRDESYLGYVMQQSLTALAAA